MAELMESAGLFFWPLAVLSIAGIFIIGERSWALRQSRVVPADLRRNVASGDLGAASTESSAGGRIVQTALEDGADPDALRAVAEFEAVRLERGLFVLEIVVAAAPLVGLLGTVTGLVTVFSGVSPETGLPVPEDFVEGVALALSTTMLGLAIAIPALMGLSALSRRVDTLRASLHVLVESLIHRQASGATQTGRIGG
jgi:biopolymer transport protein ExbB